MSSHNERGGHSYSSKRREYLWDGLKPGLLQSIEQPQDVLDGSVVELSNITYIGSYNWVDAESPTIIVPGYPRVWVDRPLPYTVLPDRGWQFINQNRHRLPQTPLLPLITAVNHRYEEGPVDASGITSFDWSTVDIVTDRNNLRKLLGWVGQRAKGKEFRIDLQLAGKKTVLMTGSGWATREMMRGASYGFNFEKMSTEPAPGCQSSTSHHRIISYDLQGLCMVVRFEVDACLSGPSPLTPSASSTSSEPAAAASSISMNGLASVFGDISIGSDADTPAPRALTIRRGGSWLTSHESIVELTTAKTVVWGRAYPQLLLSNTRHHFRGVHEGGVFTSIRKTELGTEALRAADEELREPMKKLRRLLSTIQTLVKKHGERGRLTLVCKDWVLNVYERKSNAAFLPDEQMNLFRS
ncbi:hypothetical protein HGRIS_005245 [Hohenbuehelia grisea]|uniref:Geranylgeranyl pyrophosphate synthetase n=1 Tax=Hohenbuehelia grisea TaxID=104357 RepID=A0ABR3JFE9_9AGAR